MNVGRAAAEGFWVGAYVDRAAAETERLTSVYWFVPSLAPGGWLTLSSDEAFEDEARLLLPDGRYTLSAEVNLDRVEQGPVAESRSGHNFLGPFAMTIG